MKRGESSRPRAPAAKVGTVGLLNPGSRLGDPVGDVDVVIRAVEVTKRFGTRAAVDAVTWSVRRGAVCGLMGPNGAGKTTLLRMICGLVGRTSGRLEVGDAAVVSGFPPVGLGALIESPGFIPHLGGRANLRHLARLGGADHDAVERALGRVDLLHHAHDRYRTYSLGMKQRLGVAAALLGSPELLVLDEPSNGLDPGGTTDVHDLIRELSRDGVTVVVSSHALGDAEGLCDQVAVMIAGRIVADATMADLLGPPRIKIRSSRLDTVTRTVMLRGPAAVVVEAHDTVGDHVEICSEVLSVPELIRLLVAVGVDVDEVTPARRSLSEVYDDLLSRHSTPHGSSTVEETGTATQAVP